jgi:tetratricopeptide (TPR) repeat protein
LIFFALAQIGARWRAEWEMGRARDAASMAAAAGLDAGKDEYWARWARQLEQEGGSGLAGWRRAAAANPRRGEWLMEAGLECEAAGDLEGAERLLLRAGELNQQWMPRWTLAGFYLRRGNNEEAIRWARAAARRAFGDRRALFALCREAGAGDRRILEEVVGDDPQNLAAFLRDGAARGAVEVTEQAASRYLESRRRWKRLAGRPEEALETMEIALDALLREGLGAAAVRLAGQLGREPWAPYAPAEGDGQALVNASFRPPWTGRGFSWRHGEAEGLEVRPGSAEEGVRIEFSGNQPESLEVLAQMVHCRRGGEWEISLEYQSDNLTPAHSGVRWRLEPVGGSLPAVRLEEGEPEWNAADWTPWRERWQIPAEGGVFRLVLAAQRPVGQRRVEGELSFRRIGLRWRKESAE